MGRVISIYRWCTATPEGEVGEFGSFRYLVTRGIVLHIAER